MFQVISIFSHWILIKQIIVPFTLFVLGETDFPKILPEVLIGELGHEEKSIDSMHFLEIYTRSNWKMFPTHGGTYKLEKIQRAFLREIKPRGFKEIWKDVTLRLILEDKDNGCYRFVGSNLGVGIFLKKREHHKKGMFK